MNKLFFRIITLAFLTSGMMFLSSVSADQLSLPTADLAAPVVSHEGVTHEVVAGTSVQLKANVTDNVGVKSVILFFRIKGAKEYSRVHMEKMGDTDDYAVTINGAEVVEPGIEYYIQAADLAGNTLLHGYSFSPLTVAVAPSPATNTEGAAAAATTMAAGKGIQLTGEASQSSPGSGGSEKFYKNKWLWIGVGVLAAGIIASQSGGSDNGGGTASKTTGTVVITSPTP